MLVVAAVALASVLGFVMLAMATLQNRAGGNSARLMSADYLAESGLNIAFYYLQYPDRAPSLNSSGYWAGTGGDLVVTSNPRGTINVTVTRDATDSWTYEIISTATCGEQADTRVTRSTGARAYVRSEYSVKHAAGFNADTIVLPYFTLQGDIWSAHKLAIK